jgi:hypothetical protein
MSTSVIGAGTVPAPHRLGRIAGVAAGIAIAIAIGIGMAQNDSPDLTLDRYHPGHPTISEDRQERIAALREAEPADQSAKTRAEHPKRAPAHRR